MKAVEVTWRDAISMDDWFSQVELDAVLAEKAKSGLTKSRGWLYFQDEARVVLVMTIQPDGDKDEESLAGVLIIPSGMIIEIKEENNDEPAPNP